MQLRVVAVAAPALLLLLLLGLVQGLHTCDAEDA
jgi:hypothetical protein